MIKILKDLHKILKSRGLNISLGFFSFNFLYRIVRPGLTEILKKEVEKGSVFVDQMSPPPTPQPPLIRQSTSPSPQSRMFRVSWCLKTFGWGVYTLPALTIAVRCWYQLSMCMSARIAPTAPPSTSRSWKGI